LPDRGGLRTLPRRKRSRSLPQRTIECVAGIETKIGNHTFRATCIIDYLKNSGKLELAQYIDFLRAEQLSTTEAPDPSRALARHADDKPRHPVFVVERESQKVGLPFSQSFRQCELTRVSKSMPRSVSSRLLPREYRSQILQITSSPQPRVEI
jgi:hypothetical protein